MYGRILVATDGAPGASGAIRFARLLEQRQGSTVQVFAACDAGDFYRIPASGRPGDTPPQVPRTAQDLVRRRVEAQLLQAGVGTAQWPLTVERGAPAPAMIRFAARKQSELVLVGFACADSRADHRCDRETLQKTVQLAHVPVLAVPDNLSELPRSAVVAVDFSRFSIRAAWEAVGLVRPGGVVHLAHVLARPVENGDSWDRGLEWGYHYLPSVQRRLDELAAALQSSTEVRVQFHVLDGAPAPALAELATHCQAELLAMGSHGLGFLGRLATGSTCSRLLRSVPCSLLIVPPTGVPRELLHAEPEGEAAFAPQQVLSAQA
jgi:nucleotide-binding universal stress UspA family protein